MSNDRTAALTAAGVSIWLDDLSRERIDSGELNGLVERLDVVGVTTNPTIFAAAIGGGTGYAERIAASARRGLGPEATVFELMCTDVADACDVLAEVHAATGGRDGRVSIEVSPELAHDTAGTVAQARALWERIDRPNAMIKIPATDAGLAAIMEVLAYGISVNVTLIFGLSRYREVVNAYLVGLERARAAGIDLRRIHSVASVFVSRFDGVIDPLLDPAEQGRAGIANAWLAHEIQRQSFASERARLLLAAGAQPQRPLWASTGTKNPALSDTLYIDELALPGTVNTMPAATLAAFADHGVPPREPIAEVVLAARYREAETVLNEISGRGAEYADIVAELEADGLRRFRESWAELLDGVRDALGRVA